MEVLLLVVFPFLMLHAKAIRIIQNIPIFFSEDVFIFSVIKSTILNFQKSIPGIKKLYFFIGLFMEVTTLIDPFIGRILSFSLVIPNL